MRRAFTLAFFITALTAGPVSAETTNPWSMTFDKFHKAFDEVQKKDAVDGDQYADTIAHCSGDSNKVCSINQKGFQRGIKMMKEMNLANGQFKFHLTLKVAINNGKVSQISVYGDRADPVNAFRYVGAVVNVITLFDPDAASTDEKMMKITEELGLTRGNSAPDIGKPKLMIEPYAAISCLNSNSEQSTAVGCTFEPRS